MDYNLYLMLCFFGGMVGGSVGCFLVTALVRSLWNARRERRAAESWARLDASLQQLLDKLEREAGELDALAARARRSL